MEHSAVSSQRSVLFLHGFADGCQRESGNGPFRMSISSGNSLSQKIRVSRTTNDLGLIRGRRYPTRNRNNHSFVTFG